MTSRRDRLEPVLRQAALTVGAVLGAVCILVTLLGVVAQVRPLVFRSGSMAPAIDTGALALARRAEARDLRVGEIASVPTAAGDRVSHRIVSIEHNGGRATLRLKGDGNRVPDATPYVVDHADVVLFSVPRLGYVVGWLGSPVGLFALGLYAAFFLSAVLRGSPERASTQRPTGGRRATRPPPGRRSRRVNPRRRAGAHVAHRATVRRLRSVPLLLGVVVVGTVVLQTVGPAFAAWTDLGRVEGTTQTAYTVPAPDGSSCETSLEGDVGVVVVTWPAASAPHPALEYDAHVSGLSSSTVSLTEVSGQQRLTVHYDTTEAVDQGRTAVLTVTSHLAATPSWTSAPTTWTFTTAGAGESPDCA